MAFEGGPRPAPDPVPATFGKGRRNTACPPADPATCLGIELDPDTARTDCVDPANLIKATGA